MNLIGINNKEFNAFTVSKIKNDTESVRATNIKSFSFFNFPNNPLYWQNISKNISFKSQTNSSVADKLETINENSNLNVLSDDNQKKILSYLESPKFQNCDLTTPFIYCVNEFEYGDEDEITNLFNLLDSIQDDEQRKKLFGRFYDKDMFYGALSIPIVKCFLDKDAEFINQLFDYFETKKEPKRPVIDVMFPDTKLSELFEHINTSNFEEFKQATANQNVRNCFEIANRYLNPQTRIFDKSIMDAVFNLNNNKKFKEDNEWNVSTASNTVFASVDKTTQKISPFLEEIIDIFYPKDREEHFLYTNMDSGLPFLIFSLKDKKGDVSKEKIDLMKSILQIKKDNSKYPIVNYSDLANLIFALRTDDREHIDETKKKIAFKIIDETDTFKDAEVVVKCLGKYPTDKQNEMFDVYSELKPGEKFEYSALPSIISFCSDDDGCLLSDKIEYVKKLLEQKQFQEIFILFDRLKEHPEIQDYVLEIIPLIPALNVDMNEIIESILDMNIDGSFLESEHKREKFKEYLPELYYDTSEFDYLYESCNGDGEFNDDLFNKTLSLMRIAEESISNCFNYSPSVFLKILNNTFDVSSLTFNDKRECLEALNELAEYIQSEQLSGFDAITKTVSSVQKNLDCDDVVVSIDKNTKFEFIKNVLRSNNAGCELTEFEKVMVDSIPLLETMVNGLELDYSRKEFLKDLTSICKLDNSFNILSKTGFEPIFMGGEITGYNGLINIDTLDVSNPQEKAIYDLMHRFIYVNKVKTKSQSLNEQLNIILRACPEFINTIGKKQHRTQKYTVDVHSLLTLAYSINNPAYNSKLTPIDKSLLKLTAIVHDLMKSEGEVDTTHQHTSANQARILCKKFFKSPNIIDRFYNLVNNHHWTKEYADTINKYGKAQELAFQFRHPNDFEIAKILADSDIKAVNKHFYESLKHCLDEEHTDPIQEKLEDLYKYGNAIFTDGIVSPSKLENHIYERNGKQYRVLNFNEIPENADMGEYGFVKGKKKEDINLLVHMIDTDMPYKRLNDVKKLSSPINGGVLSTSLISPIAKKTYMNRKFGVVLQQDNTGVLNTLRENQSSGVQKEFNEIMFFVFNDRYRRTLYRKNLLSHLGLNHLTITDKEYIEFYRKNLALKNSLNEIAETKEYKIGEHSFSGLQLKTALKKVQDDLLDKDEIFHNEIVCYTPKITALIALCKYETSIPDELLKFANENNLPIILM